MGIPLSIRNKELLYQENPDYRKNFTDYDHIYQEVRSILEQSRRELLIFASFKILKRIFHDKDWIKSISSLLERRVNIRILTDDIDRDSARKIMRIRNEDKDKRIQFGFSDNLGNFNELVILGDEMYALQIKYDHQNKLIASFTNEKTQSHGSRNSI